MVYCAVLILCTKRNVSESEEEALSHCYRIPPMEIEGKRKEKEKITIIIMINIIIIITLRSSELKNKNLSV